MIARIVTKNLEVSGRKTHFLLFYSGIFLIGVPVLPVISGYHESLPYTANAFSILTWKKICFNVRNWRYSWDKVTYSCNILFTFNLRHILSYVSPTYPIICIPHRTYKFTILFERVCIQHSFIIYFIYNNYSLLL